MAWTGFLMTWLNYPKIWTVWFSNTVTHVDRMAYEQCHEKTCLMPYAKNKGADRPAHLRSLIYSFVARCLDNTNMCICYGRNVKTPASFCSCAGRFVLPGLTPLKTGFLTTWLIWYSVDPDSEIVRSEVQTRVFDNWRIIFNSSP